MHGGLDRITAVTRWGRMVVIAILLMVSLVGVSPLPVGAIPAEQSSPAANLAARLVAPDPNGEISIYPQPDTRQPRLGYGRNGDQVTVLERIGRNDGTTWHRIQFLAPSQAQGWVQGEYLSIPDQHQGQRNQSRPESGGYLGQQGQSSWSSSTQPNQSQFR